MIQTGTHPSSPLQTKLKNKKEKCQRRDQCATRPECHHTRFALQALRQNLSKDPSEWEDLQCVIFQEAPHNAVLLRCSSFSSGCRAYMCDTSVRHSNCFKQYRKKNMNRVTKVLNCPYCRKEVYEAMKVSSGRRALNAKLRYNAFENCNFSGTYTQLKNHLNADHPGLTRPLVDQGRERAWEQMQTATENADIMTAAGVLHGFEVFHEHLPHIPPRLVIVLFLHGVVDSIVYHQLPNSLPQSFVIRVGKCCGTILCTS